QFQWNIGNAVSITNPGSQSHAEGATVSLAISASGSGTLTYSATGLPSGLSINSSTGAITGTISAAGAWQTTVTAGNGTASSSVTFVWDVSGAITIANPGSQFFNAGDDAAVKIKASGGGTLSYSASGLPS